MSKMYVYILKCDNNSLYTGIAVNPEQRLRQHLGLIKGGAKYTKCHKVMAVMAIWEDLSGEYARKLEFHLKRKLTHQQKLSLINNPEMSFSEFGIDIPRESFLYINPRQLNEKYKMEQI